MLSNLKTKVFKSWKTPYSRGFLIKKAKAFFSGRVGCKHPDPVRLSNVKIIHWIICYHFDHLRVFFHNLQKCAFSILLANYEIIFTLKKSSTG